MAKAFQLSPCFCLLVVSRKTTTTIPFIRCQSSTTKKITEFNISFGSGAGAGAGAAEQPSSSIPVLIPWIVRGEDGNLKLHSTPPPRLLLPNNKPIKPKPKPVLTSEPRFSKAARRFYNQNFRDPPQRLSKLLASAGVASRRSCEDLIFQGKVTVNGSVCNTPQTRVDPARDTIYVNGNRISKKLPPKLYLALNKPKGYICSNGEKEKQSKSVLSLLDHHYFNPAFPKPRLFTVGRLDVATTGLIIITNDGHFAHTISHPSTGLSKEYIAAIDGAVNKRHLTAVAEGTNIDGVHCRPDSVELLPQQPDMSRPRLRIVVHEGRNHEVRELVKNAGLALHSLKRVRIGGYRLPSDLGLGKHIELNQGDLKSLGGIE